MIKIESDREEFLVLMIGTLLGLLAGCVVSGSVPSMFLGALVGALVTVVTLGVIAFRDMFNYFTE